MPQPHRPLTIYKASAGSGKTFTLAVEYIKLLILDPQNYRYILAVTFTNKATEEMKMRILSQLYGIANNLSDSKDYMNCMRQAFQGPQQASGPLAKARFSDEEIVRRAGQAMHLILHNYNYFRVVTIDSFFQNVLRNLARELGLTANLQIGLNDEEIEQQAVDNIIENVTSANDPLLTWIMDFAQEKMDDQKDWNIIGSVKQFGRNIFQDFYKDNQEKLRIIMDNPDFFHRYTQHLRTMRKKADDTMKAYSEKFKERMAELNLGKGDVKRGIVWNYYDKLAEGNYEDGNGFPSETLRNTFDDPSLMVKKADMGTRVGNLLIEEIGPLLQETEQQRKESVRTRFSVELTLGNLNELRLLGRIEQEVKRIHDESNTYPLSATQKLIKTMIGKQDSPFIYEKIGGLLKYIMIDEFQDTSRVQWDNFKVLLDDCLAHNNGSLIVGDVKQSIYRWRNGDWHLLQNLTPKIDQRITVRQLDTNYRSKRNIIHFNNAFFQIAAQQVYLGALRKMDRGKMRSKEVIEEALDICRAYSDVAQKVAQKQLEDDETQTGFVRVKMLSKDSKKEDMIPEVEAIIRALVGTGIPQQKIAILVRYNSEITALAEYFQQKPIVVDGKQVKMVSDQAFRLDASLAVNTIIRTMKFLSNPNDTLLMATLVKAYHKVTHPDDNNTDTKLFVESGQIGDGLPQDFLADRTKLLSMPLIGMAEEIYRRFELEKLSGQSAYICALFDRMGQFMQNHLGGLDDFLNEWDENLCTKSIHSSEIDGIRLLTIHKSKGLEFDNVIFPYCNWAFESIRDILWATPDYPYNATSNDSGEKLPLVPLKLNARRLRASVYDEQYESEHIKNLVDNLNLIYVAFTRAERNLFVIGKDGVADSPSEIVREVLDYTGTVDDEARAMLPNIVTHTLQSLSPTPTIEIDDEGNTTFCYGTLCPSEEKEKDATSNVFAQKEQGLTFEIRSHKQHATFKQSNASADFTATEEEEEQIKMRQQYIQTGNVLHKLFANIRDVNDVPTAIENLEYDGVLYNETLSREQLQRAINTRLQKPEVAAWFRPGWTVFNECNILSLDEKTGRVTAHRPDRVISNGREMMVVDFKTGRKRDEHQAQVREYIALLKQMGYANIHGYLWYIKTNEVVKIDA